MKLSVSPDNPYVLSSFLIMLIIFSSLYLVKIKSVYSSIVISTMRFLSSIVIFLSLDKPARLVYNKSKMFLSADCRYASTSVGFFFVVIDEPRDLSDEPTAQPDEHRDHHRARESDQRPFHNYQSRSTPFMNSSLVIPNT